MPSPVTSPATAFISYSWDSPAHCAWVRSLATRLRADGVDVKLDQWDTVPGDPLPAYMEKSVRDSDFVIVICTRAYREKSEGRRSGVGYEGDIMTGELFYSNDARKFIPILRSGEWVDASPGWVRGKYFVDLRGDPYASSEYRKLLDALGRVAPVRPPLGQPLATREARSAVAGASDTSLVDFTGLTIEIDAPVSLDDSSPEARTLEEILLALDSRMIKAELLRVRDYPSPFGDKLTHIEYTWKTLDAANALRELVLPILAKHGALRSRFSSDVKVSRHREFTAGPRWPEDRIRLTL